ncbi:ATP-dependent zinc metalloprotease YME1L [Nomia melanderi]|uniref:ATP-dependent zinc metalloprotease YME1L n=1 Tax=Nomia melanderi TaxID=2448451 RepID=UPI0013041D58|nr:ATP-dependent zinc metalloprotease YME1L [Nomia melanderi]
MFSFQSHNQVLYHLTQLTSTVNSKPKPFQIKNKKENEFKKAANDASNNTSAKTGKSYVKVSIDKLNLHDVVATLNIRKNNVWVMLHQLSTKICNENIKENKWKVSYVSETSFTQNKHKLLCTEFMEPIILPITCLLLKQNYRTSCDLSIKNPFNYHLQIRSFRTRHNTKVNLDTKPSFMNKLKEWFLFTSEMRSHLKMESEYNRVKNIFAKSDEPTQNASKIKAAFVEGYEAGLQRHIRSRSLFSKLLTPLLPITLVFLAAYLTVSKGGDVFRFTLGRRSEINPETINVTFDDVKGVEEAMEELRNIVEFLKNPERFSALGGKLPKGILLVGPPGTGKTLLARAIAGEAGVPFFHAAGPEFDELFVGQGARRVRELFRAAKERAPAVIFIDEIDSVGAKRTNSVIHPYANQTINQLLAEMDGFLQNQGVIVLGATNRRDDLDKALLRPGRFDVQVFVNKPNISGRKDILNLYLSRVLTRDIDVEYLARCTAGFTGADIENMINQAALKAAVDDDKYVTMKHLEYARDKVLMGPEGKLKMIDEDAKLLTAYHEAGHALVSYYTKDAVPLHKVTIIPRGHSLGHTSFMPEKDVYHTTKSQLLATMDSMMGGRAAEELIFGPDKVTTGAASDFQQATLVAEQMVKSYGMSEKVGFRAHTDSSSQLYNGGSDYGPSTNELIDNEVKRLLQESYDRARTILKTHAKEHKQLAESLLKYETLDGDEVKAILNGKKTQIESLNTQPSIVDPTKHVL